jgi:hypothetical protein
MIKFNNWNILEASEFTSKVRMFKFVGTFALGMCYLPWVLPSGGSHVQTALWKSLCEKKMKHPPSI